MDDLPPNAIAGRKLMKLAEDAFGPLCCRKCYKGEPGFGPMFLCPTCGNKRCPKATDHELECTGSNAPGQAGSAYA